MFRYAVNKSFEEMKSVIIVAENNLNNNQLKKEVNYRIGTFLHWIFDYYDRIEKYVGKENIDKHDKKFFSGLRYANNKLKHDSSIIQIYQRTGGSLFPISFPLYIESIAFRWRFIDKEEDSKYMNQYNNYISYICEKEIIPISEQALSSIKKYEY
ncbi:hypothetical protein [Clostridium algidicarnis]|uniref:hypothetical protein n=1 Tax=Clostridium algidicarnis TaxID=37659 RepID=UPI001C0BAC63|nr:hypothetical protein [Clostridium algidicarnis]MBU3227372.1 hypothetical protein [Clostridium algidicarnis]MBU3251221.1 hypothetical protein [Clostridium algidicarnis]